MRSYPQQDHADLGLVDDDQTPDMRRAPAATEAHFRTHPTTPMQKRGSLMRLQPSNPPTKQLQAVLTDAQRLAQRLTQDIDDAFVVLPDDTELVVGLDLVNAQAYIVAAHRLLVNASKLAGRNA